MKRTVLDPIGMRDNTFDAPLPPRWGAPSGDVLLGKQEGRGSSREVLLNQTSLLVDYGPLPTDLAQFLIEIQQEYAGRSHKVLHQSTVQSIRSGATGKQQILRLRLERAAPNFAQDDTILGKSGESRRIQRHEHHSCGS
jgi:hypothetical protein